MKSYSVGLVTISDSCFLGQQADTAGDNLSEILLSGAYFVVSSFARSCVPDEKHVIQEKLLKYVNEKVDLVVTTGGTGISPRDVTPEAVTPLLDKRADGLNMAMMTESLKVVPTAALSRSACGSIGETLVVTLPGSRKGSVGCFSFISKALPHAMDLLKENTSEVKQHHASLTTRSAEGSFSTDASSVVERLSLKSVASRNRESPYEMICMSKAYDLMKEISTCERHVQKIPVDNALGYVITENLYAPEPIPAFTTSTRDGYCLAEGQVTGLKRVIGSVTAGFDPQREIVGFTSDAVVRISTGAPLPPHTVRVVEVEFTRLVEEKDGEEVMIEIIGMSSDNNIRAAGSDVSKDDLVVSSGSVLKPAEIEILVQNQQLVISVFKKPLVGVMSTGDELVDAQKFEKLPLGMVIDCNRPGLIAACSEAGFPVRDLGIVSDDALKTYTSLKNALERCDVLITTGGASMSEKDIVKSILIECFGAQVVFGRLFMKPGKPAGLLRIPPSSGNTSQKFVFTLPGNPVSALVCWHILVLPFLRVLAGQSAEDLLPPKEITVKAPHKITLDARPEYKRAILQWKGEEPRVTFTGAQASSRILSMFTPNGLFTMFRLTLSRVGLRALAPRSNPVATISVRQASTAEESDEEFDQRFIRFFSRPEIDGWEIRKGFKDLYSYDVIPDPKIVDAALRACRRVNDHSLAVRILETVNAKCAHHPKVWPYVVSKIRPTLDELGVSLPEELGYDKPELALKSIEEHAGAWP
ncbi:unnamed protein product [Cyprideis torosa]|uniref:Cytochrome c oxidase subunit 5A, mitochondrial n=1 Tax=Cyprideis torosa TaxID=163714 RepID=A0A7R8ZK83_9CRUS|nr:unnamed protein product [Cyprideis torosa]CAG0890247.1 unnamed protein product [Cyprideis torosa]